MLREFIAFLTKNDVLALALAVVIGAALGQVVISLVTDLLMPPVGLLLGGVSFDDLFIDLSGRGHATLAAAKQAGAATVNYGRFLNTVVIFIIVAFVVFLISKALIRPKATPSTRPCPRCTETIAAAATRCPRCTSEVAPSPAS